MIMTYPDISIGTKYFIIDDHSVREWLIVKICVLILTRVDQINRISNQTISIMLCPIHHTRVIPILYSVNLLNVYNGIF